METLRGGTMHILAQQLVQITFDYHNEDLVINLFFVRFEAILKSMSRMSVGCVTRDSGIPDSVKKTMLLAQLRGLAAHWVWVTMLDEIQRLSYDELKKALREWENVASYGDDDWD
jgi:hypothetical protein